MMLFLGVLSLLVILYILDLILLAIVCIKIIFTKKEKQTKTRNFIEVGGA